LVSSVSVLAVFSVSENKIVVFVEFEFFYFFYNFVDADFV